VQMMEAHEHSHYRFTEHSGVSRAMVYGLWRALPGERLFCRRRLRFLSQT
jgi:hypothetical protein